MTGQTLAVRIAAEVEKALASVLDGNLEAYQQLVAEHQAAVWSVLSALLYSRADTERLLREVFIQAYESLDHFDPDRHQFRDFVRTIARLRVREELKAAAARGGGRLEAYREHLLEHFADDQTAARYQHDLVERFRRCTTKLPDPVSKMLQMRYHQSQDWQTISKATHRPVASVHQQLHRALTAVATCMTRQARTP